MQNEEREQRQGHPKRRTTVYVTYVRQGVTSLKTTRKLGTPAHGLTHVYRRAQSVSITRGTTYSARLSLALRTSTLRKRRKNHGCPGRGIAMCARYPPATKEPEYQEGYPRRVITVCPTYVNLSRHLPCTIDIKQPYDMAGKRYASIQRTRGDTHDPLPRCGVRTPMTPKYQGHKEHYTAPHRGLLLVCRRPENATTPEDTHDAVSWCTPRTPTTTGCQSTTDDPKRRITVSLGSTPGRSKTLEAVRAWRLP